MTPPGHGAGDDDLAQSLKHLSLATTTPSKKPPRSPSNLSPGPLRSTTNRSPSTPRPASAMHSPLDRARTPSRAGTPSRSGTPTMLRKASMNSLHTADFRAGATPRRTSSINISNPEPLPERPPPPTAASIAKAHFRTELDALHGTSQMPAETIVILQDACYGHRFSRPRTTRSALSTIVERPERIKASVLGVSAAYVRLGERHQDGEHSPHPALDPKSLSIPFRIQKTTRRLALSSAAVTNVHGAKWMEELKMMCDNAAAKLATMAGSNKAPTEVERPDRGPDSEAPKKLHEGDLFLCPDSLDALEGSLGGLCEAIDAVFHSHAQGPKRAFVAIRPPGHHCSASYPSGFCWLNNVHVGIMHAILSHGLTHAAIIDFDLHHGDGSQAIAWDHNSRSVGLAKNAAWWKKTNIGYFSLHDINSYPCEQGDFEKIRNASVCIENAHGQSIWNVHLQSWKNQTEFWTLYESRYSVLLDKAREYLKTQTERLRSSGLNSKAAIFISAGFDASEWEGAGMQRHNVNVPTEFYARFTRDVVRIAAEEGTSVEGRIVSVLEGGYSDRALYSGILSHLSGLAGDDPVAAKEQEFNGLGYEMGQRIASAGSALSRRDSLLGSRHGRKDSLASERGSRPYESSWWSPQELDCLGETLASPQANSKPPRNITPPTYSSPTQASQAKAVSTSRRRASGMSPTIVGTGSPLSRAPTPPPPEVPWNIAAHELSKLLIPTDRQINSCSHGDLNAETTKARRGVIAQSDPTERVPTRMALRERKPKAVIPGFEDDKSRRKTLAGVLPTEKPAARGAARSRRLSAASTIVSESTDDSAPLVPPLSAAGFARPETSFSIRPESSMSVRPAGLTVKKTRAPKKDPVPRAPRGQKKVTATTAVSATTAPGKIAPAPPPISTAAPADTVPALTAPATTVPPNAGSTVLPAAVPATATAATEDMDKLTSDMRKVKITLVTKSMREARQRERLSKEAMSPMTTTPLAEREGNGNLSGQYLNHAAQASDNIVHADTLASIPLPANHGAPELLLPEALSADDKSQKFFASASSITPPVPPVEVPTPELLVSPATEDPALIPLPVSSNPSPEKQGSDVFIPYQPEGVGQQQQVLPQQPLQFLPPNVTTTPSPMKRENLPVFTSTSAIPFVIQPKTEHEKPAQSVWDIPDTPQK